MPARPSRTVAATCLSFVRADCSLDHSLLLSSLHNLSLPRRRGGRHGRSFVGFLSSYFQFCEWSNVLVVCGLIVILRFVFSSEFDFHITDKSVSDLFGTCM